MIRARDLRHLDSSASQVIEIGEIPVRSAVDELPGNAKSEEAFEQRFFFRIDLALDVAKIPEDTYRTILKAFLARGYRQDAAQPFRFFRTIGLTGGKQIDVEVDLLTGEYGGTGPRHRAQRVQGVRARKARGCDLVFSNHVEVIIEGESPGGGRDRVTFRVAAIVPWIVMKGMALHGRIKEKDAYDIYRA